MALAEPVAEEKTLALVAPGTELREALDYILTARSGALVVAGGQQAVDPLIDGGFHVDCVFTGPRLYELSKMDGAVVLAEDLRTIRFANVHLQPDPAIPTRETGTRHRTAERAARQTGALVIAVSETRRTITLFRGGWRHVAQDVSVMLARANQALQTAGEHRRLYDRALARLTSRECRDAAVARDVVRVCDLGRALMRTAAVTRRQVVELGAEGRLVAAQLADLTGGVEGDLRLILRDYGDPERDDVRALTGEGADPARALHLEDAGSQPLRPRGYRALAGVPRLPDELARRIVASLGDLSQLLAARPAALEAVAGVGPGRAQLIRDHLRRLREGAEGREL